MTTPHATLAHNERQGQAPEAPLRPSIRTCRLSNRMVVWIGRRTPDQPAKAEWQFRCFYMFRRR